MTREPRSWRNPPPMVHEEAGNVPMTGYGDEDLSRSAGLRSFTNEEGMEWVQGGVMCSLCGKALPEPPSVLSCFRILAECGPFTAELMGKPRTVVAEMINKGQCPYCGTPMSAEARQRWIDEHYLDGVPSREERTIRSSSNVVVGDPRVGKGKRARRT